MPKKTEYLLPTPEFFPLTFRDLFPTGLPAYAHRYARRVCENSALYRGTVWIVPTEKDMEWAAKNPDSRIPTARAIKNLGWIDPS